MANTPASVAFNTLGCKLNQYETDAIASKFINNGYTVVPFGEPADAYIINSCTVTNKADRKTRNTINKALKISGSDHPLSRNSTPAASDAPLLVGKLENVQLAGSENSMVVVTGCFVDSHREELENDGRTFVVNNEHKNSIYELVDAHLKGEVFHSESLKGDRFNYDASQQVFRTRGMVKIQDGCDNFCSFCIIPFVRGTAVSRDPEEITATAKQMLADGYRELVLTGVNMSRYEHGESKFSDVVDALLNLDGDYRLRISSIEPDQLDEKFIELMRHPKMTPHLHLCLQSGSEKILLKMRRQYTYAQYKSIVNSIKSSLPEFNITTDLIVGFPGEGEAEFEESVAAVNEIGFGHVHAFKYSVRQGTRAERMPEHVPEKIKSKRSEQLRILSEDSKIRYRKSMIGRTQRVLVERVSIIEDRAWARGLGEHYIPVYFPLSDSENRPLTTTEAQSYENTFVHVRLVSLDEGEDPDILGESLQ